MFTKRRAVINLFHQAEATKLLLNLGTWKKVIFSLLVAKPISYIAWSEELTVFILYQFTFFCVFA